MNERSFQRRLIQVAVASCFATAAQANPAGPSVVSGAATFNAVGKNLTVTNSPGAIINWQGFSIRPDEVTRFVQSGAASAVLNRVTGPEHSQLLGQLLSNGRVFLINQNGVTIGAGARIDTAGFVASSLNLSNEDFLAGKFRFTDPGNAGKVTNAGTINAHSGGPVYLVAPAVENHSVITAPNGDVMLAAGRSVELVSAASPHLRVQVQAGGEALNVGQLVAESGRVGIYGAAIRNSGLVSADSAQATAAGTVVLKASRDVTLDATSMLTASGAQGGTVHVQAETGTLLADGKIEAKGGAARGGEVRLLGEQVGLVNQAAVDASGRVGGGTVLVGGDYQGGNAAVQNARATYVGPEATIRADAGETGDGGKVVVWADEGTRFYGTIAARGGALGGNGGFVETSGKQVLDAQGAVDASAPAGRAGQWLLDPNNVTIQTAGVNTNVTASPTFTTTNDNAIVTTGSIVAALNAGTSVTVTTASAGANTQAGNITVANAVGKTAGGNASLTLNAVNNITFNAGANVTSTVGQLGVNLNAGAGGITNLRAVDTNGGTLTLNSAGAMTQAGVISGTGALVKNGTGTLTLSQNNTYTGATTINAGTLALGAANRIADASAVTVAGGATFNLAGFAETVGSIAGAGNITLGAAALAAGGDNTSTTFSGVIGGTGALTKAGTGTLTLSGANTYSGLTTVSAGTLSASNASALGAPGTGTSVTAGATLNINNVAIGAEAVTLNGTGVGAAGALQGAGAASLTGAVTLNTASTVGVTAAGDTLTLSGVVSGANALTKAGAGTLTLSGANTYSGLTTVSAGTLSASNAGALGAVGTGTAVTAGATLNINNVAIGAEAVTLNGTGVGAAGALQGTGTASLTGNVTLNTASTVGATAAADTLTLSGVVSGANALTKAGAGTVVLAGAANNTYTGVTNVNAGTLVAAKAGALGTVAGGTTVANGATLQIANVAIGAEAVTLNGTGVGAAGALQGTGTASLAGAVTLNTASTVGVTAAADTLTLSGVVSGANALTKAGAGTVVLSGANTYTGATTINAGTLRLAGGAAIADAGAVVLANAAGATLDLNGTSETIGSLAGGGAAGGNVTLGAGTLTTGGNNTTTTYTGVISGAGGLTKAGAGTMTLSGSNSYTGATAINAGTLALGAANRIADTSAVAVAGGATFNLAGFAETVGSIAGAGSITFGAGTLTAGGDNSSTTFSGVASGAGGLTKAGTGMLTLSGANTYTGATTINTGTLRLAGGAAIADTGAVVLANAAGATLDLNGTSETIGSLAGGGAAGGNVTLGAGTLTTGGNNTTTTYTGVISGAGGLTKGGTGTMTLSGANTYSGLTTVSAGTLSASNAGALGAVGTGTSVTAGATLNINNVAIGAEAVTLNGTGVGAAGALQGTGTASLTGNVTLNTASTVGVAAAADTLTLSGVVSGANALTKAGAGTVVLSGAANNTYTGATNVNAGTLVAAKAGALGTVAGGTTVANGATLQIANVAIGAEAVTLNGTGVGAAGALQGTGAASLTGAVTLNTASTVGATAAADTLTLSGVVSGANALTKVGAGTVVLSGANTYTGATTINAGTLRLAGGAAIADAGAVVLANAAGATLDLNGTSETIGSLAGGGAAGGNVTLGAGTLTAGGNNASTLFSGVISGGGGGLAKAGTGTLTLSGANTYAGATNVNAGTLTASNAAALGTTAGGTTVANGATLNINNVAIGNEAVTINGNGVGGAGALIGTGAASLGGQVTVATAARVGAAGGNSLALNGTVQGPAALDVAGGGTVTFGGAVGNTTALASLTTAAGTALNVNGGSVRTTGTQTYNGPVTTGGPTTLQTTNSAVVANGAVNATAGTLTLNTGAGNVTMTNAANDFATVAVTSGGAVSLVDANALALGASNLGTLQAQTLTGNLTLNGAVTATGGGSSIVFASAGNFVNNAGAGALNPGAGRWVVYSTAPAGNTFGGLASGNQAVWNATFAGNPPGTIAAGNRYVFSQQPTVTLTSTDAAKVYGDLGDVSTNYTATGLVNAAAFGNVFTQDTAANSFAPFGVTSAGTPVTANAGNYAIVIAATPTTGYAVTINNTGVLTVNSRPITVTPGPLARPYGDPNPTTTGTLTVGGSGLANGNTVTQVDVASPATATDPAGSAHALNGSNAVFGGGGLAANYTITYAPGVLTIGTRPITVRANDQARAYGDPNPTTGPYTLVTGSLAGADTIGSVNVTSPATAAAPAASVWVLTNTGANFTSGSAANYSITLQNGQLTIAQRPITVKASDQSRPYGDPNPATGPFTLVSGTLAGADAIGSVNVTSPATATSPAGGVWVLTNTGANFTTGSAANYAITLQNGLLTIDTRTITVRASNQARPYGDPNPVTGPYTITAGSLAGTDAITNVNVSSPATVTSGVGPYALTPTAANFGSGAATNYTITYADGVLTVTSRPITVTANNQAKVYGQPDPALTFTAPTVNGDVLAGALTRAPGETVAASPYAITQGTVTNANNPNYNITFVNGQLVITPAPLTIAADNKARLYGDANPPLTATFTGLTNGDTSAAIPGVALTTPAVPVSNVGTYAINVTSGANTNYTITYVNGQLVITPAPLTITADDKARPFGTPNPPFTATTAGFKLGQGVGDLAGTLALTTLATTVSPPAVYPITPGGVSSTNYTITFVNGQLVVAQGAPPTVQALVTAVDRSDSDPDGLRTGTSGPRVIDCLRIDRSGAERVLSRCF